MNPPIRGRASRPSSFSAFFSRFLHHPAAGGIALLLVTALALLWANSPWAPGLSAALAYRPLGSELAAAPSVLFWVNDGLMTVFFLAVGLEIRHEMHAGSLQRWQQAALPVGAALGGVAVPALVFLLLLNQPEWRSGWAVPTATDIAFAVGVLALLGRRIPVPVRIFLLTLAIIDDVLAVLIIALFYTEQLNLLGIPVVALGLAGVWLLQRQQVGSAWAYCVPGALVWAGMLMTGIHPTLAGVLLGLMTPVHQLNGTAGSPASDLQGRLHLWVAFFIMPVFALANAGVSLQSDGLGSEATGLMLAVGAALVLGKPLGIGLASWAMLRLGWGQLPAGMDWRGVLLVGLLAGIGFTMAMFIATLAFEDGQALAWVKLGVLGGSALAAVLGLIFGFTSISNSPQASQEKSEDTSQEIP